MKFAVVVNPITADNVATRVRASLADRGIDAVWFETSRTDPGTGVTQVAVALGATCVIVCGGDGTVRACSEALAGTNVSLAVAPAGTGNLLARNLDPHLLRRDPVATAMNGHTSRIDLISVNGERYAVMAGAGLDATMVRDTSRAAKNRFGSAAYVATLLEHLRDRPIHTEVTTEEGTQYSGDVLMMLVANHGHIQVGMEIAPGISATDGLLDAILVSPAAPLGLARIGLHALLRHGQTEGVHHFKSSACRVTFDRPLPYEIDGENRPETESLGFVVEKSALTVCLPDRAG